MTARQSPSANDSRMSDEPVEIKPLRYWHIPRALVTESRAFTSNPATQYVIAKGYEGPLWLRLIRTAVNYIVSSLFIAIYIRYFATFNVANGVAFAIGSPGANAKPPPNHAADMLTKFIAYITPMIRTAEQQARSKEFKDKMDDALQRVFGERAHEYAYLQLLCTDPVAQGRGYGSALVRAFNDMVDDERRSAFLVSTDERNATFYNAAGFVVVQEWTLGESNARWQHKPVVVSIMIREAAKSTFTGHQKLTV